MKTRMIMASCVALCLLGVLLPREIFAQQLPDLTQSTRLRVTTSAMQTQIGTYHSLSDSTLTITARATPVAIPLMSISRLEYSRGRHTSALGSVAGFVVGALAGGLAGCAANRDDYGVFCGGQNDSKVVTGAAIGGAVGIGLAGAFLKRERWSAIDLPLLSK